MEVAGAGVSPRGSAGLGEGKEGGGRDLATRRGGSWQGGRREEEKGADTEGPWESAEVLEEVMGWSLRSWARGIGVLTSL